jgi:hypothetical protein
MLLPATPAEGRLPPVHHEDKRGRLLIASHKLPHVLRKLRVRLPLLEAVLVELRGVVSVAVHHVLVETLLAEDLAVVYLHRVLWDRVAEVCNERYMHNQNHVFVPRDSRVRSTKSLMELSPSYYINILYSHM